MKLFKMLSTAQTEEELKNFFAKFFDLNLNTKNYIDLYTEQILFEFKLDANLKNISTLATCLAQTNYYLRRLKFGLNGEIRKITNFISIVTKNYAVITESKNFSAQIKNKNFDWDLAPSSPCKNLVKNLAENNLVKNLHVYDFSLPQDENNFINEIKKIFAGQTELFLQRKIIDQQNFFPIFQFWEKIFGDSVRNGRKSSEYFIVDIEEKKSFVNNNSVFFKMNDGTIIEKILPLKDYKFFWDIYEKISAPREIISIRQKMDRMTEPRLRRFTGEFFTPINFAAKAVDYLTRIVGDDWFKNNFRLWDMCAGTGNLEFALPAEAWKFCYISTLNLDDANYCKKIFPDATVFQYDYLNDDVQFFYNNLFEQHFPKKMPKNLVEDLKNPALKWIIFINPPYATASNYQRENGENKFGVSFTKIRELMAKENLGKNSMELFYQFLYRINLEFGNKLAYLGMFSKIKYINSKDEQKFRDKIFNYKFERGFVFNSQNFDGCKGKFPVGFLIWNLAERIAIHEQEIFLDIFNSDLEKYAVKKIYTSNKNESLNKWIKRPRCTKKFPPNSSGIKIAYGSKSVQKVAENFLASFMLSGNDFSNQNYTAFLSGAVTIHGNVSIIPENFEQAMVIHAVRRIPKATWINDRDQFMQPEKNLSLEFISDCVVWSIFSNSNQTVSLRNVEYEGEIYRLKNNLYPFRLEEIKSWEISDLEIKLQIELEKEDRYCAKWIAENFDNFSIEAREVLECGKNLYKKFYLKLEELDRKKYKIEDWDAGWYQVRMSLGESVDLKKLSEKILPQIYSLGFLRDEVKYF